MSQRTLFAVLKKFVLSTTPSIWAVELRFFNQVILGSRPLIGLSYCLLFVEIEIFGFSRFSSAGRVRPVVKDKMVLPDGYTQDSW